MLNRNLLPFHGSQTDPAALVLQTSDAFTVNDPTLRDQLAEDRTALHGETLSTLEINIMAAMWNFHPRPLRISEIYLAARSSVEESLDPCIGAINCLVTLGLINASGAPLFHYQLTRQGIFAALYLAVAGVSDKFSIARAEHHASLTIAKPPDEVEIEYCHTSCGRITTGLCDCGNAVCSVHRYHADGHHDPAGSCSACYDEIVVERAGGG